MTFINTVKYFLQKKRRTVKKRPVKHDKPVNNKAFNKMNCHPRIQTKINEDSCLTPDILIKIKEKYNQTHPTNKITESNPNNLWHELKSRFDCKKEECWLNQLDDPIMRKQIKDKIFAPKHPPEWNKNPDEWLSNYDIFEVTKQYEDTYPEFKIIGPTSIDFDTELPENGKCVLDDLCKFSLESFINAKKTKIGIVFNLDKHYESGSHWVSMFIDLKHKFIFYFDSADNEIPPEIWQSKPNNANNILPLVNRIIKQGKELKKPIHFKFYNNRGVRHQNENTECGMYSLFFIITMLTGKTPFSKNRLLSIKNRQNLFMKTKIPDNVVFKYRKLYFND